MKTKVVILIAALLIVTAIPVEATQSVLTAGATEPEPTLQQTSVQAEGFAPSHTPSKAKSVDTPRLDGALAQLMEVQADRNQINSQEITLPLNTVLVGDRILVVVEGDVSQLTASLAALGGEIDSVAQDRLSVLAPISALRDIAALKGVDYVRLPLPAVALQAPQVGSVTSEGVTVVNADDWHLNLYTGAGVKAAIIDFGFYNWTGLQASLDLPAGIKTVCRDYTTGSDCGNTDSEKAHGSACAEILYDVAPGIDTLYLYSFDDDADLGAIVDDMIANGVQVASMSIGWVNGEPYDGSGPIATQVNRAKANGIFWTVAAGNGRQRHYEATFDSGNCTWGHDFDSSGQCGNLNGLGLQQKNEKVCLFLEWNAWPVTNQDYDLLVFRRDNGNPKLVAAFEQYQNGDDPPTEGGCFIAPKEDNYYFAVHKFSATTNHYLEVFSWYDDLGVAVQESSVTEPATADGAVAVAAFAWNAPASLESFSSMGPRNPAGGGAYNPSACSGAPSSECKPDFAGPDRVSTASYGSQNFGGTSAAAPHIAGMAALVQQAHSNWSPDQIYNFLRDRAPEHGILSTNQDTGWGWGAAHLGNPPIPTAVTLVGFEASEQNGVIHLEWETATETSILGFNLYRSDAIDGSYTLINENLIPSNSPGSPVGSTYNQIDSNIEAGATYYYKLEAVNVDGFTLGWGPVQIVTEAPTLHRIFLPAVFHYQR